MPCNWFVTFTFYLAVIASTFIAFILHLTNFKASSKFPSFFSELQMIACMSFIFLVSVGNISHYVED